MTHKFLFLTYSDPAMIIRWSLLLLSLLLMTNQTWSANILAIIPTPSISHQLPFQQVARVLADRGHYITYITPNPMEDAPENITQIDVSFSYEIAKDLAKMMDKSKYSKLQAVANVMEMLMEVTDKQLGSSQVQELIQSDQKFDLFILESQFYQAYFGLHHKVGSPPLIGFLSLGMSPATYLSIGNPFNPSYMPPLFYGYTDHMSFWQRLHNTLFTIMKIVSKGLIVQQEQMLRKYFGDEPPSVFETMYNFSLYIHSNHFSSSYPAPQLPNVVGVTGLHVKKERKPLPKDIQRFLDGAKDGAVYFSLGSNVRSKELPPETIQSFLEAFSELPQRVLWKWEADSLPGQPDNVMVAKWLPQQDVLAHANIRTFITQGGLQSFNEASYFGVPFVVIPFIGDQEFNAVKMEASGIGVWIEPADVNKETVLNGVRTVLENPSYRENMRRFSAVYREHQEESLDKAVWWIEYVIRHNGARHLRSAALDLRWWQLLLLDVAAFLLAVVVAVGLALYFIVRKLITIIRPATKSKND